MVVNTTIHGNGRHYPCRPLTSFCGISANGCTTRPSGILQPLSRSFEQGTVYSVERTYLGLLLPTQERCCQNLNLSQRGVKLTFFLTVILSSEVGGDERRGKSPGGCEIGGGATLLLVRLDHCHLQSNSEESEVFRIKFTNNPQLHVRGSHGIPLPIVCSSKPNNYSKRQSHLGA